MTTRRMLNAITYCWTMLGITLVFVFVFEFAARQYNAFHRAAQQSNVVLEAQEWGSQYASDVAGYRWRVTFAPYVEFRPALYKSKTINVDELGIRATPGATRAPRQLLAFGGSTMLGYGVPDWGTIPAYLAKQIATCGADFSVVNQGVGCWTSSQSVAQLLVLLRRGSRPNVVLFYDGINDIDVVTLGGPVGGILPEAAFRLSRGLNPESSLLARVGALSQVAAAIRGNPGSKSSANPFVLRPEVWADTAKELVRGYEANVRFVEALAKDYGFTPYFFWEPFPLIAEKPRTKAEVDILAERSQRAWEVGFIKTVYAAIASSSTLAANPHFRNMERVLDSEKNTIYADSEHLLPRGNEKVAESMLGFMTLCGSR